MAIERSTDVELVYEPPHASPVADLICIHGIGHDWRQTWRCGSANTTWVQHQLPEQLPFLRIGCWGCTIRDPIHLTLVGVQNVAGELLKAIQKFRGDLPKRPIIFIAHSFGGVVLKQALLAASKEMTSSLPKDVAGILFLSVPTKFLTKESWNKFISNICSSEKATDRPSFELNSRSLVSQTHKLFSDLCGEKVHWKPRIYSICESLPVYREGVLVPPVTAIMKDYPSKTIAANHFSITLLDRSIDSLYYWICSWLQAVSHDDEMAINSLEKDLPSKPQTSQDNPKDALDGRSEILHQLLKYPIAQSQVSYALLLEDEGYYAEAELAWKTAKKACQDVPFEPSHPVVLFCRDKLAYNYWHQGKYEAADEICEDVLRLKKGNRLHNWPAILATIRNKVLILRSQSKLPAAYKTLVENLENAPSMESDSLSNLPNLHLMALLSNDIGDCEFSEFLFEEVVRECHTRLGPDHPYTLKRMSDLSVVFATRGKAEQANEYNLRAYEGLESRYGMDHPAVLRTFKRYAMNMLYQGEYNKSCKAFETLLPRYQDKMGDKHPACLSTMSGLAIAYILRGSVERGRRLLERTLRDMDGKNHRATDWSRRSFELLDGNNPQRKADQSANSIYQRKIETFVQEKLRQVDADDQSKYKDTSGSKHGNGIDGIAQESDNMGDKTATPKRRSNLMPSLDSMPTDNDTKKFRVALLRGTSNNLQNVQLKKHIQHRSSFYGGLIHIAAYSDNLELVRQLLDLGVNLNQKAGVFRTPLKAAIIGGNICVVKELLKHPLKLINDSSSHTPLHTAIVFGERTAIKLLLPRYTGSPDYSADVKAAEALLNSNHHLQLHNGVSHMSPTGASSKAHESSVLSQNSTFTMKSNDTTPISPPEKGSSSGAGPVTEGISATPDSLAAASPAPNSNVEKVVQQSMLSSLVTEPTTDGISSLPNNRPPPVGNSPEKDKTAITFNDTSVSSHPPKPNNSKNLKRPRSSKGKGVFHGLKELVPWRKNHRTSSEGPKHTGGGMLRRLTFRSNASSGRDSGYVSSG